MFFQFTEAIQIDDQHQRHNQIDDQHQRRLLGFDAL
jgi:hypothetical protein